MKNYQFIVFALVGLVIAGALLYKGRKKGCSCGDHADTVTTTETDGK